MVLWRIYEYEIANRNSDKAAADDDKQRHPQTCRSSVTNQII